MSTEVQTDWANREFVEMIERSCRQSVGFLNRFYQSAKYRLAVLDQRLTRVERKLDYIEASLENADVTQRGGKPVPFSGSLFEPESRVEEVRRKLERRRQARGIYTNEVIRPKKTIQKVLTIDSSRATMGGAGRGGVRATPESKEAEAPRRPQAQPGAAGGRGGGPPGQPGPPSGPVPAHARAGGPGRQPQPGAAPGRQQPGRAAGRRPRAAPAQPGAGEGPGEGQPRPPSSQPPGQAPPSEPRPFPHGDPTRIDMQTVQPGQGSIPKNTSQLEIAYTGWLMDERQFIEHREVVQLGVGQNIAGLEEALKKMTEGQRCKLWIPSGLAYGPDGAGELIPPNSDLTFDIKLMRIVSS